MTLEDFVARGFERGELPPQYSGLVLRRGPVAEELENVLVLVNRFERGLITGWIRVTENSVHLAQEDGDVHIAAWHLDGQAGWRECSPYSDGHEVRLQKTPEELVDEWLQRWGGPRLLVDELPEFTRVDASWLPPLSPRHRAEFFASGRLESLELYWDRALVRSLRLEDNTLVGETELEGRREFQAREEYEAWVRGQIERIARLDLPWYRGHLPVELTPDGFQATFFEDGQLHTLAYHVNGVPSGTRLELSPGSDRAVVYNPKKVQAGGLKFASWFAQTVREMQAEHAPKPEAEAKPGWMAKLKKLKF